MCGHSLAPSPGHSQILSRTRGRGCEIKSGSGLGMRLGIHHVGNGAAAGGRGLMCSLVPRLIPKLIWEQDIGTEKMSAGTSSPPRNFSERLPALCVLSSFIDEHEQWIDSLLQQLGWQKQSLSTKVMNHRRDINETGLVSRSHTPFLPSLAKEGVAARARQHARG